LAKETFLSLTRTQPANLGLQQNLAAVQTQIAALLSAMGKIDEAMDECREAIRTDERLVASDPQNAEWRENLSINYEQVGDLLHAKGDMAEALKAYEKRFAIAESLAVASPDNLRLQRNLAIGCQRLGNAFCASGNSLFRRKNLLIALEKYENGLHIAARLLDADSSNPDWLQAAALNQEGIGNVLYALGDRVQAAKAFEVKLQLCEHYASIDPTNVEWQRDLSVSYYKVGMLALERKALQEAKDYLGSCFMVLESMRTRNVRFDEQMTAVYNQLGAMFKRDNS
jgi:tetratricopeptide (TPR) repeat protein